MPSSAVQRLPSMRRGSRPSFPTLAVLLLAGDDWLLIDSGGVTDCQTYYYLCVGCASPVGGIYSQEEQDRRPRTQPMTLWEHLQFNLLLIL